MILFYFFFFYLLRISMIGGRDSPTLYPEIEIALTSLFRNKWEDVDEEMKLFLFILSLLHFDNP